MIKRELSIFLIVGSLTVVVDFTVYRGLVFLQLLNVDMAKAVGFLVGTVFAYFANRFWTFGHKSVSSSSVWRFIVLYAATLVVNVYINALALDKLAGLAWSVKVAFLLATGMSATMNFFGMKLFVFRSAIHPHKTI
jgi:putative flippase GtrA